MIVSFVAVEKERTLRSLPLKASADPIRGKETFSRPKYSGRRPEPCRDSGRRAVSG